MRSMHAWLSHLTPTGRQCPPTLPFHSRAHPSHAGLLLLRDPCTPVRNSCRGREHHNLLGRKPAAAGGRCSGGRRPVQRRQYMQRCT